MQEPMRVIALSALVLPLGSDSSRRSRTSIILHRQECAKVLENPCRDAWQKPQEVVGAPARIRTKYVKLTGKRALLSCGGHS
jgi:hypothetical protein